MSPTSYTRCRAFLLKVKNFRLYYSVALSTMLTLFTTLTMLSTLTVRTTLTSTPKSAQFHSDAENDSKSKDFSGFDVI